jgi:hypothetical protein
VAQHVEYPRFAGRLVLFKPFAENTVIATIQAPARGDGRLTLSAS